MRAGEPALAMQARSRAFAVAAVLAGTASRLHFHLFW